jgi:phenylalanyl-tRNA synthetase alpha chain
MNHNIKDIEEIAKELKNELEKIDDYQSFQNLKSKYLGKNGIIKSLMKNLKELDEEQRKNFGKNINELKNIIEEFFE